MAHAINTRANAPADALRDDLGRAERLVVNPKADNVEEFLLLLDQIEWRFDELANNGVDLRPERGRREGLHSRLSRRPEALVRATRRAGGLAKLRQRHADHERVDTTNFWWHLGTTLATRRYRTVRRLSIVLGSIVGVLVLVYWALMVLFPPSPETLLVMEVNAALDELILQEDWAQALAVVDAAREEAPDELELLAWSAVFNERLGNVEIEEQRVARGLELSSESPAFFWNQLGQNRLNVSDLAGARAAAEGVLTLNADSPEGHFLLANVAEFEGDLSTAINLFERTFELAQEENPQLAVISRVRVGTLLQRAGGNPFAAEPPTDSATLTETAPGD